MTESESSAHYWFINILIFCFNIIFLVIITFLNFLYFFHFHSFYSLQKYFVRKSCATFGFLCFVIRFLQLDVSSGMYVLEEMGEFKELREFDETESKNEVDEYKAEKLVDLDLSVSGKQVDLAKSEKKEDLVGYLLIKPLVRNMVFCFFFCIISYHSSLRIFLHFFWKIEIQRSNRIEISFAIS